MYLTELSDEEIKGFIGKFDNSEVLELLDMFQTYNKNYEDSKARKYEKALWLRLGQIKDTGDLHDLDLFMVKDMLLKLDYGELVSITYLLEDISTYSEKNANMFKLAKNLLTEKRRMIMVKDIENLTYDEVRFYLKNISSNSLEWYAIDTKSEKDEVEAQEFHNHYHDSDVKRILARYK